MKIGNKRLVYSNTFLIPKGDVVSGDITITKPSPPAPLGTTLFSQASPVLITGKDAELPLGIEISVNHTPKAGDELRVNWKFDLEPKAKWSLEINGPLSAIALSTAQFFDFAKWEDKKLGFWASFFGTDHLCTVHIQLLLEE